MKRIILIASLVLALAISARAESPDPAIIQFIDSFHTPATEWWIVIPPVTNDQVVLVDAPLSQWLVADKWPSEAACLQELPSFPSAFVSRVAIDSPSGLIYGSVVWQARHATCIAQTDPRLRANIQEIPQQP